MLLNGILFNSEAWHGLTKHHISVKWILAQDTKELFRKVIEAQKRNPTHGDVIKLVEENMKDLGTTYEKVISKNILQFKAKIKINARRACFKESKLKLSTHKTVKHLKYKTLEMQPYLRSANLHPQEVQTLTALPSNCVRTIKTNYSKM